jgi:hypothetical protein
MIHLETGKIVRHKGERKVVRQCYTDKYGKFTIEFVDRTKCTDMKELELDGRK